MRSAVQKQLEGVQKGLRGMKEAEKAVKEIKVSMGEVEQLYQDCAELSEVVRPIKEVNKRHQQVQWLLCCHFDSFCHRVHSFNFEVWGSLYYTNVCGGSPYILLSGYHDDSLAEGG